MAIQLKTQEEYKTNADNNGKEKKVKTKKPKDYIRKLSNWFLGLSITSLVILLINVIAPSLGTLFIALGVIFFILFIFVSTLITLGLEWTNVTFKNKMGAIWDKLTVGGEEASKAINNLCVTAFPYIVSIALAFTIALSIINFLGIKKRPEMKKSYQVRFIISLIMFIVVLIMLIVGCIVIYK